MVLVRAFIYDLSFPFFLATLHHMLLVIPHHTCYTIMPPKPVTTKPVRDAVARRVPDLAPKRVIADFGTFPTSYFNKRQKQYTFSWRFWWCHTYYSVHSNKRKSSFYYWYYKGSFQSFYSSRFCLEFCQWEWRWWFTRLRFKKGCCYWDHP